jgi:hypothetical protein
MSNLPADPSVLEAEVNELSFRFFGLTFIPSVFALIGGMSALIIELPLIDLFNLRGKVGNAIHHYSGNVIIPLMQASIYLIKINTSVVPYFAFSFPGNSQLTENYRKAKGCLAALKPVVQKVTSPLSKCLSSQLASLEDWICNHLQFNT